MSRCTLPPVQTRQLPRRGQAARRRRNRPVRGTCSLNRALTRHFVAEEAGERKQAKNPLEELLESLKKIQQPKPGGAVALSANSSHS